MLDGLHIKTTDGGAHYEITRTLSETVDRANVEQRLEELIHEQEHLEKALENLDEEFERLKEERRRFFEKELEKIKANIQVVNDALNTGEGQGSLEQGV